MIPDLHHIFQKVLIKHIYFRIKRLNVFKKNFSENHLKSERKKQPLQFKDVGEENFHFLDFKYMKHKKSVTVHTVLCK